MSDVKPMTRSESDEWLDGLCCPNCVGGREKEMIDNLWEYRERTKKKSGYRWVCLDIENNEVVDQDGKPDTDDIAAELGIK